MEKITAQATPPTAAAFNPMGTRAVFGLGDGSVRPAKLTFVNTYLEENAQTEEMRSLEPREVRTHDGGIVVRTPSGQLRNEKLVVELEPAIALGGNKPIRLIDYTPRPNEGEVFVALSDDGRLEMQEIERRRNLMLDEITVETTGSTLPFKMPEGRGAPDYLLLSDPAQHVYVAWKDGTLLHFDTKDFDNPKLVEEVDLVPDAKQSLTALEFLLGKATLLAGDSTGMVRAWFCVPPADGSKRPARLVAAHEMPGAGQPVSCLACSGNTRLMAVGYQDRSVRVYYPTNQRLIISARASGKEPLEQLAMAPGDDGLLGIAGREVVHWTLDPRHPETNFRSLFLPIWYEDNRGPAYVWQSGSGSVGAEPKLSLIPLVFGTLKATFYSMLFGVPLALCAAIYSSEFMRPRLKSKIKPAIEMMASLPSVVLGFLAGAVVAPFVENSIALVVCSFFTVPFALLLMSYLWQLLPQRLSLLAVRWRLVLVFLTLPLGLLLASAIAPWVELNWFGGNMRVWLDGQGGDGRGGWILLLLPATALLAAWIVAQRVKPVLRRSFHDWRRSRWTQVDLVAFLVASAAAMGLAWLLGGLLDWAGFDPRGQVLLPDSDAVHPVGLVGTYIQRNAMIVGFVMGFAIIPIIYTIAEDALSMVPDHLRSASLGAGATPWQTAIRIIVPTAMSGLFSAVMIGLGRAVGETMIVLMAAGNTPIMDWNIFNGFQTLSSLIAQEMPESVRDSTHYRTLFLAALTLFALTFLVNSVAEIIRLRFRRRAYEL